MVIVDKRDQMTPANEEVFQSWCAEWFWNNPLLHHHRRMLFMVNNNSHNAIEGARKKSMGVVRGPSDLVLVCFMSTVYIELKMPGGVQLHEQIDFMNKVRGRGHRYFICYTYVEFKALVLQLLNVK